MARRDSGARGWCERLVLVLGDQLDASNALIGGLDGARDVVLMAEVARESRHVTSHVQRTVMFLSAMRHFAADLRSRGVRVRYVELDDPANSGTFGGEIERAVRELGAESIACVLPGEWRVLGEVRAAAERLGRRLDVLPDTHFLTTPEAFAAWAGGRASITMEFFYREQRRRLGYLMEGTGPRAKPSGGAWNFDASNRVSFGKVGPRPMPRTPLRFAPDATTRGVLAAVERVLPDLPGSMEGFGWAVTRAQGLAALSDFVEHRLAEFGPYEDAMWDSSPFVYHSALSPALNLKLISPKECCDAAEGAYRAGRVPLQSAEAFIRQIIGWREFIRGVYWLEGSGYADRNGLDQHGRLPSFYWTGDTDMACMRACIGQVLDLSWGHHIQRLMVTGNFALISGVHPKEVSDWYLGMFADGVDWVTLPNALGMVMHADKRAGSAASATGVVGTKPYAASGKYIERMSNYCVGCRYDPGERTGERACPFNVFYWEFLSRNRERLRANQRMAMILKNVDRMSHEERVGLTVNADALRRKFGISAQA